MAEFYKFHIGDWNVGTDDLTLEQEAALLRVVNATRLYDQPIKHNLFVLAGLWRCNERKAKRLLEELVAAGKVTVEGGEIVNRRAVDDASTLRRLRVDRASAGSRGGVESAKSRAKARENNDTSQTSASTREEKRREEKKEDGDDASARGDEPTFRERILAALGADPVSGLTGHGGTMLGNQADMAEAVRWQGLGLTEEQILAELKSVMAKKRDGPPKGFRYFSGAMQRLAGELQRPALNPQFDEKPRKVNDGTKRLEAAMRAADRWEAERAEAESPLDSRANRNPAIAFLPTRRG
jgi:hypothetical protein